MSKIIALDADGVLLDYHAAYRIAWFRAFGVLPEIKDSRAYFPMERWDVRILVGHELTHFRSGNQRFASLFSDGTMGR